MTTIQEQIETCEHRFICDFENGEVVCQGCAWAIPLFENKALRFAPSGRKLSSPSVKDSNLGSDQNQVIADLRRGSTNEDGKRVYMLSGGLRFFRQSRHQDEDLIKELTDRLHGRVSDSQLAAIAAIYRKGLTMLEREKRKKAVELMDSITGESK